MGGGAQEGLVGVLAVDVHEAFAHGGQERGRGDGAVQVDAASARLRHPAAHDEFVALDLHSRFFEQAARRRPARRVGQREDRFDDGLFGVGAHEVAPRACSQREGQSVEDDGLARSRLSREDVQAGAEGDLQIVDDGEVRYSQQTQHGELTPCGRRAGASPTRAFPAGSGRSPPPWDG